MESATQQPLPPEIRVDRLAPDRLRYLLPRRPLGGYRWLAAAPLAFGLFGLAHFWTWFAACARMPMLGQIIFAAFGVLFAFGTVIVPIALSLALICGRCSIEIRDGQFWTIEHVGPFRWRRRWALTQIRRFEVRALNRSAASQSAIKSATATSLPARFSAIRIETLRGRSRMAALGYPRDWLLPLAHELARQIGIAKLDPFDTAQRSASPNSAVRNSASRNGASVDVVDAAIDADDAIQVDDGLGPIQRLQQPTNSRIVMTQQPGSLSFAVPAAGIRRSTLGLFVFACIWMAFMVVFTYAFLFLPGKQPQQGLWVAIPFLGVFWLVGFGLLLGALNMARRRAAIAVADGRCLVIQTGLFGEKKKIWEPGELTAVQVGPSGMKVNERPVIELQFISPGGGKFGILASRDVAELEWLATHLTKALALIPVPTVAGAVVLVDVETQPSESSAFYEERPGSLTISIPPLAWRKGPLVWWIVALFWNAIIATGITTFIIFGWKNADESLPPLAILGVLQLIGMILICVAIDMTIRRAEFAFSAGRLLVLRYGLFGERRNEWSVDELSAIRAAASGTTVNDRRLMQLQIVPTRGTSVKLLTGRDTQELAWLATQLRRATNLPAETN